MTTPEVTDLGCEGPGECSEPCSVSPEFRNLEETTWYSLVVQEPKADLQEGRETGRPKELCDFPKQL